MWNKKGYYECCSDQGSILPVNSRTAILYFMRMHGDPVNKETAFILLPRRNTDSQARMGSTVARGCGVWGVGRNWGSRGTCAFISMGDMHAPPQGSCSGPFRLCIRTHQHFGIRFKRTVDSSPELFGRPEIVSSMRRHIHDVHAWFLGIHFTPRRMRIIRSAKPNFKVRRLSLRMQSSEPTWHVEPRSSVVVSPWRLRIH
jgi:hypothetical protein